MAKNIVVVESPTKAKTIGKYLGSDYQVRASMGHVRDLPKSTKTGLGRRGQRRREDDVPRHHEGEEVHLRPA